MSWKEHVDIFNDTLTGYFVYFQNVIGDEYFLNSWCRCEWSMKMYKENVNVLSDKMFF